MTSYILYLKIFADPSVDRRSGFLSRHLNTKILEQVLQLPTFALNKDKNFILTNKLYVSENPLIIGEYHQAFKNSNLLFDFGYTEGFKKQIEKEEKKISLLFRIYKKF